MILKLTKIRQQFADTTLKDPEEAIRTELSRLPDIGKGSSIAVAVGSRGINQIRAVVTEVSEYIKSKGGKPFIVPAMGSHGGATAEGQLEVLESYGITEQTVGAPVRSSMEVAELPGSSVVNPLFMDKNAWESDGIILINKIKPHTDFHSTYESGLVKMSVIGLGKEKGAEALHHFGVKGLKDYLPICARKIISTGKIIAGLALIENAYDRLMMIRTVPASDILEKEPELLHIARKNRPGLPATRLDVLIIDRMGKNISGVGIDTNIIGRLRIYGQEEPESPDIKSIIVTDLTDESHGNATGIGLADIITRKLYDKIDFDITYKNIVTSSFLERAKIPLVAENDEKALWLALRNCGNAEEGKERVIRIRDTLHLDEIYVSDAVLDEIRENHEVEIIGSGSELVNKDKSFNPFG